MKFLILACAILTPAAALAEARTPAPLTTKETGRLMIAASHLEDCEDALARGQWTDSCDLARTQVRETSGLRTKAAAWCRAYRASPAGKEGAHPGCARFGGDAMTSRMNRLEKLRQGSR